MANESIIKLFDDKKIRIVWNEEQEKYYFSVVDIVQVLTDSADGRKYWNKLKERLKKEGNESVTNCHQVAMVTSTGKIWTFIGLVKIIAGMVRPTYRPVFFLTHAC